MEAVERILYLTMEVRISTIRRRRRTRTLESIARAKKAVVRNSERSAKRHANELDFILRAQRARKSNNRDQ